MTQEIVLRGNSFQFTVSNDQISRPLDPALYDNLDYYKAEQVVLLTILSHFNAGVDIEDPKYIKGIDIILNKLRNEL